MNDDKLDKLIELNQKIIDQNNKIITQNERILKFIVPETDEDIVSQGSEFIFDSKLDCGEVLFLANSQDNQIDIYKLTVNVSDEFKVTPSELESDVPDEFRDLNNEIIIDNLTGSGLTDQFKIPLIVAFELLNNNASIESNICILDDEIFNNLPDMLRVAMENGADKIHLPLKNANSVVYAPQQLLSHLEFYRNSDEIIGKLL